MSPLAWVGLTILALPWLCSAVVLAFAVAVWWHRPRVSKPVVIPVHRVVRPDAKTCPDCSWRQRPDWTACWRCGANMDREPSPHLWV